MIPIVYLNSCPNCGGDIDADSLQKGSACKTCINVNRNYKDIAMLISDLKKNNTLKNLAKYDELFNQLGKIEELFEKTLNSKPIALQKNWIKRILLEKRVAIIAPTGMGKTTLGIILAIYFASKQKRALIIVPTKTLVEELEARLNEFIKKAGASLLAIGYHSEKLKEILEQIKDADIVVTTSRFALSNIEMFQEFDFLFVDDVDAIVKSKKSTIAALKLFGFTDQDIETARNEKINFLPKAMEKLGEKIIVFSSATVYRSNLLITYTLGFKPGGTMMYLRNVIDVAHLGLDIDKIINVIKKLGRGGLMFFSLDKSELQNIILQKLNEIGIKAAIGDPDTIKDFATGKYDVLLGVAYHYGKLVRGIDLPEIVKYAIFVGIPKFRFRIGEVMHPIALVRLLSLFARYDQNAKMLAGRLRRRVLNLSPAALEEIYEKAKEGKLEDEEFVKAYQLIQQLLQREDLKAKLNENSDFVIEDNNITTPDYITYLQASGRTSRLLKNKITLGLSIVFAEDQKLLEILEQRLAYIVEDIKFKELNNTATKIGKESLEQIKAKLEKDRETIGKSKAPPEIKSVLMIVESPYKAKTISRFFSKPSIRIKGNLVVYEISLGNTILQITSTQGHLFDLTTKPIGLYGIDPNTFTSYYDTIKRCENGHQFVDGNKCPKCGANIILDKTNFVEALRELALENDEIIIGSDPDVEGERIAWDIYLNIRPFNSNIKRGEFHEVTKHAILEAINNPRNLNVNLLYSQLVRRIEDRWVGFKLSEKVQVDFWVKILGNKTPNRALSAGRVQTPVLGWIIDRFNKYNATKQKYSIVKVGNELLYLPVVFEKEEVNVEITKIKKAAKKLKPLPPYTTDTLLEDVSRLLGISSADAMKIAQDLFEAGLITYHRTDSTRISAVGISVAETFLSNLLGNKYKQVFSPRSWAISEGAHEGIRPTKPLDAQRVIQMIQEGELILNKLSAQHLKVYNLIFKRFITSQLKPLKVKSEEIEMQLTQNDKSATASIQIYTEASFGNKEIDNLLMPYVYKPKISTFEQVNKGEIVGHIERSEYPLYTEGDVIKEMKDKKIGRPSTYSTIISTLEKRNYIKVSKKRKKLIPTKLGEGVYHFLSTAYSDLVSEKVTAKLLENMDEIESGKKDYRKVLKQILAEISNIQ